jgi:hypothetical protein
MSLIEFKGKIFIKDKVVAVDEVSTIQTGSRHCDWDFGFVVRLEGNNVEILVPTKTDVAGNHLLSQADRVKAANIERNKFIELLKV